uniref:Uncharacterized protein n=1 Tax=Arundo donax TaxID=35708 RepID=A0A0A9AC06_ARUDO
MPRPGNQCNNTRGSRCHHISNYGSGTQVHIWNPMMQDTPGQARKQIAVYTCNKKSWHFLFA